MKKEDYTKEALQSVLYSYLLIIESDGEKFPSVVVHDIKSSIKSILKTIEYTEKDYKQYNEAQRQKRKKK